MSATEMTGALPTARRAEAAFAALAAVQLVMIASITMLTVALPQLQRDWGSSSAELVVLATSYSVTFGALLLVAGRAADRFGPRRMAIGALAVFAVASVAAAAAPGMTVLVTARLLQGVGAAFAVPAAMALIPAVFTDSGRRIRATAVWGVLAVTGAAAGTVISGFLVDAVSWRWLFIPVALIASGAAVVIAALVPIDPAARSHHSAIAPVSTVAVTAGLTALLYGLAAESLPLAGAGLLLLAGFVVTQRHSSAPLLPVLGIPGRAGLAAILISAGANASLYYLLTLYMASVGYSPAGISAAFVPAAIMVLLAGPAAARLLGRYGARAVLVTGLLLGAAGTVLVSTLGPYLGLQLAGLLIFPFGVGLALSAAMAITMAAAGPARQGSTGGLANTAMETGPPLVLALVAPLARTYGDTTAFLVLAAALAAIVPIALLAVGRARSDG
ncbi:MFS transporter [Nocardia goodfellowii]